MLQTLNMMLFVLLQISLDDEPDLEDPDQTVDPQQWLQDKMAKLLDLGQRSKLLIIFLNGVLNTSVNKSLVLAIQYL